MDGPFIRWHKSHDANSFIYSAHVERRTAVELVSRRAAWLRASWQGACKVHTKRVRIQLEEAVRRPAWHWTVVREVIEKERNPPCTAPRIRYSVVSCFFPPDPISPFLSLETSETLTSFVAKKKKKVAVVYHMDSAKLTGETNKRITAPEV